MTGRIEVFANIGSAAEASAAVEQGAEGVGLLRTEFLFLDRAAPPDEDEQVQVLTEIARSLAGRPVVVRTLDAGADKPLPFLRQDPRTTRSSGCAASGSRSPSRRCFNAAARGPARGRGASPEADVPDGGHAGRAAGSLAALKGPLELGVRPELETGVMVEVPALAPQAEQFAREVDSSRSGPTTWRSTPWLPNAGTERWRAFWKRRCPGAGPDRERGRGGRRARTLGGGVRRAGRRARGRGDARWARRGELSMAASRIPAVKAALRESDTEAAAAAARGALESARASWQRRP